ncbi:putative steryl acetyl hydrolase mug81, partial [Coemansia sp. RSA 1287]
MSIWEELQSSIARESSLRRALLGLDSTPESISKCDDEADDSLAFYASHPSLRPMPDILLRPDLEAYVRELESKRIQQVSSSGQKDSGKSRHTGSWLLSKCRQIIVAAAGVEAATDAAEALCTEVFKVLRCDRTDDDIQGQLLELVGFDNMEFLGQLVSQRANIVRGITDEADRARVAAAMRDRAIPGVQAIIRSEKDVAIEKEINKARRKAKGKGKQTEDGSLEDQEAARILGFGADLRRARERQLSQRPAEVLRPEAKGAERYPHIYTSTPAGNNGGALLSMFGSKYALPAGTVRNEFSDHEEITIPIAKAAVRRATEQPIAISDMDPLC